MFRLQGGPGVTNMTFKDASRFADRHDVVLIGYRGIDGSVRLQCPEVVSALKHSADFLGEESFHAYTQGFRSCATRLQANGVDLAGYGLPQRVDDLEAARKAFGYGRIDLVSESVGTRTAMILLLALPNGDPPLGDDRRQPARPLPLDSTRTTRRQIRKYAALCPRRTCQSAPATSPRR